jgi:hypothetical protein
MTDFIMSGLDDSDKDEMILRVIKEGKLVRRQTLVDTLVNGSSEIMSLSTFNRWIGKLIEDKKIMSKREGRNVSYCLTEDAEIIPQKMTASELDSFLLEEAKKLASDIIESGLHVISTGEALEYEEERTKNMSPKEQEANDRLVKFTNRRQPWLQQIDLSSSIRDDNSVRRDRRAQLLKRCTALFLSLKWLEMRRTGRFPRPWGGNFAKEIDILGHSNSYPHSPNNKQPSLTVWLEFCLGVIDKLGRRQQLKEEKCERKLKKPGRPKKDN